MTASLIASQNWEVVSAVPNHICPKRGQSCPKLGQDCALIRKLAQFMTWYTGC